MSPGLQAQNGTKIFTIGFGATAHNDFLVTPSIVVTAGVSTKLTFWSRSRDPLYAEDIAVKVSTTTSTSAAFTTTLIGTVNPPSGASFYKYEADLTSYVGQTIYIAFVSTTTDLFIFDIDNIVVGAPQTCVEPVLPATFANITTTTATLNWIAANPSPATGYEIFYSSNAVPPTNATAPTTITAAGVLTKSVIGLSEFTKYYVYVRSACSATSKSPWGSVGAFTTSISPTALPYSSGFDTNLQTAGWTLEGNNLNSVSLSAVANTALAHTPQFYFILNTTPAPAFANNNFLFSRAISLTAAESVTMSFWYRTATARNLRVTVGQSPTSVSQTTTVWSNPTLPTATTYEQITTPVFVAPTTGIYYFAFNDLSSPAAVATLRIDTVAFTSVLSTSEFISNKFSISPNPTNSLLNINSSENIGVSAVSITDLNGRVIRNIDFNGVSDIQLNVSDLSSGMYMLNIKSEQGTATKKFMKN